MTEQLPNFRGCSWRSDQNQHCVRKRHEAALVGEHLGNSDSLSKLQWFLLVSTFRITQILHHDHTSDFFPFFLLIYFFSVN